MFIAALFTIAKTWKQPKGPSIGMDREDVVYQRADSRSKKNYNPAACRRETAITEI